MTDKREVIYNKPGGIRLSLPTPQARLLRRKTDRPDVRVTPDYLRNLPLYERDRDLVRYLGEIGYATTDQLARMFFAHTRQPLKQAQARLLQLWQWRLLDRAPGSGLEKYGIHAQLVYSPGEAGLLMLSEDDPEGHKLRKRRGTNLMYHNVLLSEALTGMADIIQDSDYDLIFYGERGVYTTFQWQERVVKMRPDGLLYIEGAQKELPLFLELDTGMRAVDSFRAKVLQYDLYFRSNAWKTQYGMFPGVGVIVWAAHSQPGWNEPARIDKAERRLVQTMEYIKKQHPDPTVRWMFARLDQACTGKWLVLDRQGAVHETSLFPALAKAGKQTNGGLQD